MGKLSDIFGIIGALIGAFLVMYGFYALLGVIVLAIIMLFCVVIGVIAILFGSPFALIHGIFSKKPKPQGYFWKNNPYKEPPKY